MILTPYGQIPGSFPSEVTSSIGPSSGQYLCPRDPQHNTTGEDGYYDDTHLGGASGPQLVAQGPSPSDFDYAQPYGYTPMVRGWVSTPQGYVQGSFYPQPPGVAPMPPISPPMLVLGNAEAAAQLIVSGNANAAEAAREKKQKNILFWATVISTSIIATGALVNAWRGFKGLRHDKMIRDALAQKLL